MTKLLDKAVAEIRLLPAEEQDAIATEWLERAADERRWDASFADPRSRRAISDLAAEARAEISAGRVLDFDPGTRRKQ
jgi:hypothetical protein